LGEEAALLDTDPGGRRQASGDDSVDVAGQVLAAGEVTEPDVAVA
jgi:hypothetical protein